MYIIIHKAKIDSAKDEISKDEKSESLLTLFLF